MAPCTETRPYVVHTVTRRLGVRPRSLGPFEVRAATPRIAAVLLGIAVADLDCVRDRDNLADLGRCPVRGPDLPRAAEPGTAEAIDRALDEPTTFEEAK